MIGDAAKHVGQSCLRIDIVELGRFDHRVGNGSRSATVVRAHEQIIHHPGAFYKFTPIRKGRWSPDHLKDFMGWLHADGYAGFKELYRRGGIKEVACLAHIRRKFFDIHVAQGSGIAKEALERIASLYQIAASKRGDPPDKRRSVRQEHAASLIDNLQAWLLSQLTHISGKSALAGAIRYGLTCLKRLRPYIDDGCLSIDNNATERGSPMPFIPEINPQPMGWTPLDGIYVPG